MYGQEVAGGTAGATLAVTGLSVSSWILIAVGVIAVGVTLISFSVRWKHRNGPKP